jgi:hypothetical protein
MKAFAAILLFALVIGITVSAQAQTPSGAVVGPTYLASLYGVKCDGSTNDTTALINLVNTVHTSAGTGGGPLCFRQRGVGA